MFGLLYCWCIGIARMFLMYSLMGVMGWDDYLILIIASAIISIALAPKQQATPPTAFDDIDFPQADEGTPQCVFFGDAWSGDWTVLAVGNYRVEEIGGGGGGKK